MDWKYGKQSIRSWSYCLSLLKTWQAFYVPSLRKKLLKYLTIFDRVSVYQFRCNFIYIFFSKTDKALGQSIESQRWQLIRNSHLICIIYRNSIDNTFTKEVIFSIGALKIVLFAKYWRKHDEFWPPMFWQIELPSCWFRFNLISLRINPEMHEINSYSCCSLKFL